MTLPTGTISLAQVNVELGRAANVEINMNEGPVRTLAGVPSGAISMDNLRGKTGGAVWTPAGGDIGSPVILSDDTGSPTIPSQVQISYSTVAVWNWTRTGSTAGTASVPTGQSGASIVFSLPNPTTTQRSCTFELNSVANGVTKYWTINLTNYGAA